MGSSETHANDVMAKQDAQTAKRALDVSAPHSGNEADMFSVLGTQFNEYHQPNDMGSDLREDTGSDSEVEDLFDPASTEPQVPKFVAGMEGFLRW